MSDDTVFTARLADALQRLAEFAPEMDDESIARTAIDADVGARAGWLAGLRSTAPVARLAYRLLLLALLFAAVLIAVAAGVFRRDPLPLPGGNGAIVYSFGGNGHDAVTTVAINPDGTGDHPIEALRCPAYSANGEVLAWLSYEGPAYLVSAHAGKPSRRTLLVEAPQQSVSAAVSPDGRRVAWFKPVGDSSVELWVAPLDGSESERIVAAPEVPGERLDTPIWSPDGRLIAFGTFVADDQTGERRRVAIDVVGADGSDRHRLTTRPGLLDDGMAWSPDNRYIAYVGQRGGTTAGDLFVVGPDGNGDRPLTSTATAEHHPAWSPDGAFIGFETSAEGESDRVTVMQVERDAPVGEQLNGPESDWFVWSPDGRLLLWQELTTVAPETFRTTLKAIDREFRQPSTTLQVVDGLIVCPPTWQRLDP